MRLTAVAGVWLLGMALAYGWYDADPLPLLLLSGFFLVLSLICRLLRVAAWPAVLVAVCLLGIWRYELSETVPPPLLVEHSGQTHVNGRIVSDPETTATRIKFTLQPTEISTQIQGGEKEQLPEGARILAYAHPPDELVSARAHPYFRYGDQLELTGALAQPEPIERFDYPAYLESQGIYAILWAQDAWLSENPSPAVSNLSSAHYFDVRLRGSIYELRRMLSRGLERSLPQSEAALAKALLLGLRGELPDEVVENFRASGTSHLLAISGLHLGILLLLTIGLLHWALGRHTLIPLFLALVIVWSYVVISGAPASVVRAALMGSVYLAALVLGRPRESLLPALAFSVLAMTTLDPRIASQISFQLSFAALAGIALALPWQEAASRSIAGFAERFRWRMAAPAGVFLGWATSGTIISAAATLATFPLVALNFGAVPLLGIPSTILATPLLPFGLMGGLAAGVAGGINPLLGQLIGLPASMPLTALLLLVDLTPKWTVEIAEQSSSPAWIWYATLLVIMAVADSRIYRRFVLFPLTRFSRTAGASGQTDSILAGGGRYFGLTGIGLVLAAAVLYLSFGFFSDTDGRLHVYFLDVGQGDAIFVVTPNGRQALIDGGPEFGGVVGALSEYMPPWDRTLDLVASTHLDADHSRGLLRVLEHYKIGAVATGASNPESHLYVQWRKAVEQGNHRPLQLSAGQQLELDSGVMLEVLHPPSVLLRGPAWDSNNNSLVLRLSYGEVSFLLTGDIEEEAERYLKRASPKLESDVLKAGHHGSNSSTTTTFLRAVKPRWAIISAGEGNQYDHPHPAVLKRLDGAVGRGNVFSTATQGTVHFSTDGQRLGDATER